MKASLLSVLALVVACGGSAPPTQTATTLPPTTSTAEPAAATATARLGLGDLKFFQGDTLMIHLHPDGTLELATDGTGQALQRAGTISADGKLTGPDGKSAQLQDDGTLVLSNGQDPGIKLDGETLVIAGKHVTLDPQGAVLVDGAALPSKVPVRIEGVTDAGTRRTALLLVALTLGGAPQSDAGPVETK